MKHANNPENQKPNGPHDLGQIIASQNPFPWVVVEKAGRDDEQIANDFRTFKEACENLEDWYGEDERESFPVIIMRRRDDGTLTTEY